MLLADGEPGAFVRLRILPSLFLPGLLQGLQPRAGAMLCRSRHRASRHGRWGDVAGAQLSGASRRRPLPRRARPAVRAVDPRLSALCDRVGPHVWRADAAIGRHRAARPGTWSGDGGAGIDRLCSANGDEMTASAGPARRWDQQFRTECRRRGLRFVAEHGFIADEVYLSSLSVAVRVVADAGVVRVEWMAQTKPLVLDDILWAAFMPDADLGGPRKRLNVRIYG